MTGFSDQPTDRLQNVIDGMLELARLHLDDDVTPLSVVVSVQVGEQAVTGAYFTGEEGQEEEFAAFEVQLRHTIMSARQLGIGLRVMDVNEG